MRTRLAIATGTITLLAVVGVMTATQNYLAKYNASGALVDSAIYESAGNVGIGTANPGTRLSIDSGSTTLVSDFNSANAAGGYITLSKGAAAYGFIGNQDALTSAGGTGLALRSTGGLQIATGSATTRMTIDSSGNVGIGTSFPDAKLRINTHTNAKGLHLDHPNTGLTNPALFVTYDGVEANAPLLAIQSGSPKTDRFHVFGNGNVGVGTSAPSSKLHVAGDIKVDGNIAAKYQDVAEWVDTTEAIEPGTVVSTDRTSTNRVRPSSKAYDTAVAGVVSQQPGIILGERGTGKVAVTQSGRVRVKVDARYGAIQPGDLLVASPTEGHAMRSEAIVVGDTAIHRPGTIVGKALQAWTSGRGDVLVLVTLQ
ncbi:MAG TPA: hypothetical protein VJM31_09750 [Vicinamibacterales bacterium]|nr:hypothetical protein [Vicinamibacterales bacterium]